MESTMNTFIEVQTLNEALEIRSAVDRVRYMIEYARSRKLNVVQTTSFGIQSAMMIQLLAMAGGIQDVPIVFIDTGYLPAETYQFAEQMKAQYGLNLLIYQSDVSPARMEATVGKLWEDDSDDAHRQYNTMRKVLPMEKALKDLDATIILTGLRSSQTMHRQSLSYVNVDGTRWKVCPMLDWDDALVESFFKDHHLPYHPLFDQGYRTVGDWHSSSPYDPRVHKSVRDSRFHGRTQECGLHVSISNISFADATSSSTEQSSVLASIDSSVSLESIAHSTADDGYVIYGRPNCKYCRAAKTLLHSVVAQVDSDVRIHEIHVGNDISSEDLIRKLGRHVSTVPQILYNGHHIGGYDDLCRWGLSHFEASVFRQLVDSVIV